MYRQWSPNQAVYQNPLRRITTRLEVIWHVVLELQKQGGLTPERLEAWSVLMLQSIRMLYQCDPALTAVHLYRLRSLNPGFIPNSPDFARSFALAYRLLGFACAEWLAGATRFLRTVPPPAFR